ncbi:MAG: YlxR family protein [Acidimicrobiaceae bacterium]|nr:YlxR family protein [Acidimicrobiaceae bacterium]
MVSSTKGLRTCLGCGSKSSPDSLIRLRTPGRGQADSGRGAWICRESLACLDRAVDRGQFQRAFKTKLDTGQLELLKASFKRACQVE